MIPNIYIRESVDTDFCDIMNVEKQAFGYDKEAILTAELLNDETAKPRLSLLAFHNGKAVGHILFTRIYLNEMEEKQPLIHILAPLAVIPEYQKCGIGGKLINEGLKRLQASGSEMVLVLGHMDYYPRHGFIHDAGAMGYAAPFPIPEEFANAWMIQFLQKELTITKGKVICCNALNKPEHWRE